MDVSARKLIALPTAGVAGATPITSTNPLVEIGIVTAAGIGTACPIINWSGGPLPDFAVTLHFDLAPWKTVALATGEKVTASADKKTFTFAMSETVDALIFR